MALPTTRNRMFADLANQVAANPMLIHYLEYSYIDEKRDQLTAVLCNLLPDDYKTIVKDVWRDFNTYCM